MPDNLPELQCLVQVKTILVILAPLLLTTGAVVRLRGHRGIQSLLQLAGAALMLAVDIVARYVLHQFSSNNTLSIAELGQLMSTTAWLGAGTVVLFAAGYLPDVIRTARDRAVSVAIVLLQVLPVVALVSLRIILMVMARSSTMGEVANLQTTLTRFHVGELLFLLFATAYLTMNLRRR